MATRRKVRLNRRITDARTQQRVNAIGKHKERARRDARMMEIIKAGSLPYTPDVMSWLSRKLDKPSSRITPDDVASLNQ